MAQAEKRLFTAIALRDEIKDTLYQNARLLEKAGRIRLTERDNFHLTLVYIGETMRERDVLEALYEVKAEPFELEFGGPGFFKRPDGLLLWQGVQLNEALKDLQSKVYEGLRSRGLCRRETSYMPHVTLGRRFKAYDRQAELKEVLWGLTCPVTMPAEAVSLFESKRVDNRLVYEELERIKFS